MHLPCYMRDFASRSVSIARHTILSAAPGSSRTSQTTECEACRDSTTLHEKRPAGKGQIRFEPHDKSPAQHANRNLSNLRLLDISHPSREGSLHTTLSTLSLDLKVVIVVGSPRLEVVQIPAHPSFHSRSFCDHCVNYTGWPPSNPKGPSLNDACTHAARRLAHPFR